jgi:uncharacterized protein
MLVNWDTAVARSPDIERLKMADEKINYIEFPATDIAGTKRFFTDAFGWDFIDYGPEYAAFSGAGIDGGFYKSTLRASTETGSALAVLYSSHLESSLEKVTGAGGKIIKPIFSFPGGRRFHFIDPSGNEYAVWSE